MSTLKEAIAKLKRANKELPERINRALDHNQWLWRMKESARYTLEYSAIFDTTERAQIPLLVELIMGASGGNQMTFTLNAMSVAKMLPEFDPHGDPVWDVTPDSVPQEVVDWVANYKDKTEERDMIKSGERKGEWYSDPEIASRVLRAMEVDPEPWFRTDKPGHGALNPRGLAQMAHLTNLPTDKISDALLLVLYEWKKGMTEILPPVICQRIREAFY